MSLLGERGRLATSSWERFSLFLLAATLPFEVVLPTLGGRTIPFVICAALGCLAIGWRPSAVLHVAKTPLLVFLAVGVAAAICMELSHGAGGITEALRWLSAALASLAVAALCRDRSALRAALLGHVAGGASVSLALVGQLWPRLRASDDVSVRLTAFEDFVFPHDLNSLSFFAAQAAILCIAFLLRDRARGRRWSWAVLAALCSAGALLTMSRGGGLVLAVGIAAVLLRSRRGDVRWSAPAVLLVAITLLALPKVTYERFLSEANEPTQSRRLLLLVATWEHLPDYLWNGVGVEQFHGRWGLDSQFRHPRDARTQTTHTTFSQIAIYWGLPAVVPMFFLVLAGRRTLPERGSEDPLAPAVVGISLALLVRAMVTSSFQSKEFVVGLGLLAAGGVFLWPRQTVAASQANSSVDLAGLADHMWFLSRWQSLRAAVPVILALALLATASRFVVAWISGPALVAGTLLMLYLGAGWRSVPGREDRSL